MSASPRPYFRVYMDMSDDPAYEGVYDDPAALGWWLRLAMAADAAWPAAGAIPRSIPDDTLALLSDAGIVQIIGKHRDQYRIRGMDEERQARSDHGRLAIETRWARTRAAADTPSSSPSSTQSIHATPRNAEQLHAAPRPRETTGSLTMTVPTEGECRICGGFLQDSDDLAQVGPGWIAHAVHPDDEDIVFSKGAA